MIPLDEIIEELEKQRETFPYLTEKTIVVEYDRDSSDMLELLENKLSKRYNVVEKSIDGYREDDKIEFSPNLGVYTICYDKSTDNLAPVSLCKYLLTDNPANLENKIKIGNKIIFFDRILTNPAIGFLESQSDWITKLIPIIGGIEPESRKFIGKAIGESITLKADDCKSKFRVYSALDRYIVALISKSCRTGNGYRDSKYTVIINTSTLETKIIHPTNNTIRLGNKEYAIKFPNSPLSFNLEDYKKISIMLSNIIGAAYIILKHHSIDPIKETISYAKTKYSLPPSQVKDIINIVYSNDVDNGKLVIDTINATNNLGIQLNNTMNIDNLAKLIKLYDPSISPSSYLKNAVDLMSYLSTHRIPLTQDTLNMLSDIFSKYDSIAGYKLILGLLLFFIFLGNSLALLIDSEEYINTLRKSFAFVKKALTYPYEGIKYLIYKAKSVLNKQNVFTTENIYRASLDNYDVTLYGICCIDIEKITIYTLKNRFSRNYNEQ